ncbi:substrate-binding domain-containing protein [Clostridium bovifaecis]|uniref:Substrate-binding domain-containing protein n=1 Tax=Clostridium bovifaecis TaxID=2184719 RepID=A0A6I6FCT4_9CLOT|nr:substrate-binding domain-containing protein [Clostridium bovifaecis]
MAGKKVSILVCSILVAGILGGCSANSKTTSSSQKEIKGDLIRIGVTQVIEHPALDSAREGFTTALKDKGYEDGKNIKIDFQNAQGDMPTTQTIAEKFVNDDVKLIAAIATPSAQAAFNATQKTKKNIPIVITAVTDPIQAGLVKALDKPGTNVTGTSDAVSIEGQFELIKKLIPNAKNIGIVYNTSEANSEIQVNNAKKVATDFGFNIVTSGITNTNEIPQALNSILEKIDVLYVPTDNMVAAAIPTITQQCYSKNIPVIGSESAHVKGGAVATAGIDYYKLGYETGLKAVEILGGKKIDEIPVTTAKETSIVINEDAAKKLNIKISEDISSKAEKVTGGVK